MKKVLIAGLLVASTMTLTTGVVSAGENAASTWRDCVIEKAGTDLDAGQMALLQAHGDGEINILSTARDNGLGPLDGAKVHTIMWLAGASCALGG